MISIGLEIQRGTFTLDAALDTRAPVAGLYGPSGSGKTTLLHALAGLVTPTRGRIVVDGEILFDRAAGIAIPPESRGIGVVFQDGRLFPHRTVRGNLTYARPRNRTSSPGFDEVVELFELGPLLDRYPSRLSGGETRLVAVARALLANPRLLLLDEPLTGLDPERRDRVLAFLLRLRETRRVRLLYVSHAWSDFLALVDEVFLLGAGTIRGRGSPRELTGPEMAARGLHERLETTWLGEVQGGEGSEARVRCGDAEVSVRLPGARRGDRVVVAIPAEDVILSLDSVPRTSARNRWTGSVVGVHPGADRVLVEIDAGPRLWAEITPTSAVELGLGPGQTVEALVKTAALRATGLPGRGSATTPGIG